MFGSNLSSTDPSISKIDIRFTVASDWTRWASAIAERSGEEWIQAGEPPTQQRSLRSCDSSRPGTIWCCTPRRTGPPRRTTQCIQALSGVRQPRRLGDRDHACEDFCRGRARGALAAVRRPHLHHLIRDRWGPGRPTPTEWPPDLFLPIIQHPTGALTTLPKPPGPTGGFTGRCHVIITNLHAFLVSAAS